MNSGHFTSCFSIRISFTAFCCLKALAETSSTVLTEVVKTGIRVLFWILEAKLSVFHHRLWRELWVFSHMQYVFMTSYSLLKVYNLNNLYLNKMHFRCKSPGVISTMSLDVHNGKPKWERHKQNVGLFLFSCGKSSSLGPIQQLHRNPGNEPLTPVALHL